MNVPFSWLQPSGLKKKLSLKLIFKLFFVKLKWNHISSVNSSALQQGSGSRNSLRFHDRVLLLRCRETRLEHATTSLMFEARNNSSLILRFECRNLVTFKVSGLHCRTRMHRPGNLKRYAWKDSTSEIKISSAFKRIRVIISAWSGLSATLHCDSFGWTFENNLRRQKLLWKQKLVTAEAIHPSI